MRVSTVATALSDARARIAGSEARLLLAEVIRQPVTWLLVHGDAPLSAEQSAQFDAWVSLRASGQPIAYLLTRREFYGRDFFVDSGVLIPRAETELLVDTVLAQVGAGETANILDLGTGSGCIAITIALERPAAIVTAVDQSQAALHVARRNAATLHAKVQLSQSDWFSALSGKRFDLIVGNPPYIRIDDPHLAQGDLPAEPPAALIGGEDGLDALRNIIARAPDYLTPGGQLWLEHGYDQACAARELLDAAGFKRVESRRDLSGTERISGGRWM